MEPLEQCQQWFEQDEAQKVIDALEAIPAGERTPELDSELAKAYIAIAEMGDREPFEKALELLAPHETYFAGDHCWNYRIASAYYYLDEEGPALRYFEKALEARPGDNDTQEYIDDCRRRLSLPRFEKNFRERTQEAWAAFSQIEAELRQIIDTDETHQRGEELVKKCGNALKTALRDTSFELGFNGEKYELILSPEGLRSRLFPLVYFQKQAPETVCDHWNIWVGRQPCAGFELRAGEIEVRAEDVQMWAEETEDHQVSLVLYCEKLTPILKEDTDKVWWALSMLVDQTIGEVSSIALIAGFDVCAQPKDEPAKLLSELPELVQSMGLSLWRDGGDYLENSYRAYELEPVEDPEADWRLDVYTGSCRLPVLINDYLTARADTVDEYHRDGIAAGFLCYPVDGFAGEDRAEQILQFRDDLRDAILEKAGAEAVTFLGGATGLYFGYLDFLAWDLPAVLDAARDFFEELQIDQGGFHTFRRDVGTVRLWEKEIEPDIHPETGSLLSAEDIETLAAFDEGVSGYFGKMLGWLQDFIQNGVEEGRFSEKQAHQDLQIALWYAFACLNLDDYIHYYRAAEWIKDSEKNATGCATWYYRYSVALMYCGRLEEALEYAERGAKEEPDYPWIWLQVGKLRAHFGDKSGALDAVKQGLKLEPGDYEFLTLKKEIKAGATLEQMEYHWINPDADQTLQRGLDENADDKQCAIACIRVDEAGLAEFYELFHPERYNYEKNSPCCEFQYPVEEHLVELSFRMNEAGLSKMGADWLRQLKERLDSGEWLTHTPEGEPEGILTGVFVDQTRRIGLVYQQPGDDQYFQIFLNPDGTKADAFWSSRKNSEPEVYSEDEMSAIEQHIQSTFGAFDQVFHELDSPDIHVDICVVPPSERRNYYTLVTMGMGAHRMNVPKELAEYKLERAELAIALPPDWKLDEDSMQEQRWYWPVGLLKVLARLPISNDTWLGFGHTMEKQSPFAEDTELCAAILTGPQDMDLDTCGEVCILPGGEEVNFYQVLPLYREEMEYKLEHDADALLERLAAVSFVVCPDRPSCLEEED
ncbi:MAG: suppressor of fused domain protein [Faecalibacterium sp.]